MDRRSKILMQLGLAPIWVSREIDTYPGVGTNMAEKFVVESQTLDKLEKEVQICKKCELHQKRKQTVFGVGDQQADWLFIGEAPGEAEDGKGEPFVGQAGQLLDNILFSLNLDRTKNVYIANVIKCRPPGNRNPETHEVMSCKGYLTRQIELLSPRIIVALGKVAALSLLDLKDAKLASMRGNVYEINGIPTVVTYHPAYLLRNPKEKIKVWEDLCFASDILIKSAITQSKNNNNV